MAALTLRSVRSSKPVVDNRQAQRHPPPHSLSPHILYLTAPPPPPPPPPPPSPSIPLLQPVTYNIYYGITSRMSASRLQKQQSIADENVQLQRRCASSQNVSQCKKNPLSSFLNPPLSDPRTPFSTCRTLFRSSSAHTTRLPLHDRPAAAAAGLRRPSSAAASSSAQASVVRDRASTRARPASASARAQSNKPREDEASQIRFGSARWHHPSICRAAPVHPPPLSCTAPVCNPVRSNRVRSPPSSPLQPHPSLLLSSFNTTFTAGTQPN
jgi:hypothetical protein